MSVPTPTQLITSLMLDIFSNCEFFQFNYICKLIYIINESSMSLKNQVTYELFGLD